MLADAAEGACRTLVEPTPSRIESLVHDLAMKRLLDGQFDECGLTLKNCTPSKIAWSSRCPPCTTAGSSTRTSKSPDAVGVMLEIDFANQQTRIPSTTAHLIAGRAVWS